MILLSSNKNKIKEFERAGVSNIKIKNGIDLPEVLGTAEDVIVYKAFDAMKVLKTYPYIVEDTILEINNQECVDIKFRINELKKTNEVLNAKFIVSIAVCDGNKISYFSSSVDGVIKQPKEPLETNAFGFDQYFYPLNSDLNLYQLDKMGKKDEFSARSFALHELGKFINNKKDLIFKEVFIKDIKEWDGKYQNNYTPKDMLKNINTKKQLER